MRYGFLLLVNVFTVSLHSQNLQAHYDLRGSLNPKYNEKNFLTLYFEYFKSQDFDSSTISPGSFLIKMQGDLNGATNNIGKFYMQVSQSVRFWKPKVYLAIQYSGGLGITEPGSYGYYINNAFSLGAASPFQWDDAWFSASISYMYTALQLPGHDVLCSLYWLKGLCNYKLELSGDFQMWTLDRNHGDANTASLNGKRFSFFGEPQFWYNLNESLLIGSKINLYYHILTYDNVFQVYPTVAIKYKL